MKISTAIIEMHPECGIDVTYRVIKLLREVTNEDVVYDTIIEKKHILYNICLYICSTPSIDDVSVFSPPRRSAKFKELYYTVHFPCKHFQQNDSIIELYIECFFKALYIVFQYEKLPLEELFHRIEIAKNKAKLIAVGNPIYEINDDETAVGFG